MKRVVKSPVVEEQHRRVMSLMGGYGYSAKGIVRVLSKEYGCTVSPNQVYYQLRKDGISLWSERHAETEPSFKRAVRLTAPTIKVVRAKAG